MLLVQAETDSAIARHTINRTASRRRSAGASMICRVFVGIVSALPNQVRGASVPAQFCRRIQSQTLTRRLPVLAVADLDNGLIISGRRKAAAEVSFFSAAPGPKPNKCTTQWNQRLAQRIHAERYAPNAATPPATPHVTETNSSSIPVTSATALSVGAKAALPRKAR
jgi:hypothetical protein